MGCVKSKENNDSGNNTTASDVPPVPKTDNFVTEEDEGETAVVEEEQSVKKSVDLSTNTSRRLKSIRKTLRDSQRNLTNFVLNRTNVNELTLDNKSNSSSPSHGGKQRTAKQTGNNSTRRRSPPEPSTPNVQHDHLDSEDVGYSSDEDALFNKNVIHRDTLISEWILTTGAISPAPGAVPASENNDEYSGIHYDVNSWKLSTSDYYMDNNIHHNDKHHVQCNCHSNCNELVQYDSKRDNSSLSRKNSERSVHSATSNYSRHMQHPLCNTSSLLHNSSTTKGSPENGRSIMRAMSPSTGIYTAENIENETDIEERSGGSSLSLNSTDGSVKTQRNKRFNYSYFQRVPHPPTTPRPDTARTLRPRAAGRQRSCRPEQAPDATSTRESFA